MLSKIRKNTKKILKIIKKFPQSILSTENSKKAKITQYLIDLCSKKFKNARKIPKKIPKIQRKSIIIFDVFIKFPPLILGL
jgi:hypothetical protein